jgi:hypothetical protein
MVLADRRLAQARDEMRASGIYTPDELRGVNELCCRARWRLGQLLASIARQTVAGPGRGKQGGKTIPQCAESFLGWLK